MRLLLAPLFLMLTLPCLADEAFPLLSDPDQIEAKKLATPPKIDGSVEDQEWSSAGTSARSMVDIGTAKPNGNRGQYWLGYDDEHIYFAARIWIDGPRRIVADEFRENVSLDGNDTVTLLLDPMGSTRDVSFFTVNPNGATEYSIAGGRANKAEWLGRIAAAGRILEDGWECEVRIPWRILPLPSPGLRNMRYIVDWYVSANQRGSSFHSTQGDFSKLHTWRNVQVPRVDARSGLLLLPYTYFGIDDDGKHIANAGLDFKTDINNELNLVGTINPDFRNIENDILSLDFSNFERLAEETRPFFQEGRGFLRTGLARPLFASQRIRQFDYGFNVYGTLNGTTQVGALTTVDQGNERASVMSIAHSADPSLFLVGSFVGYDKPGQENSAGHIEFIKRMGEWQLIGNTERTQDEVLGHGVSHLLNVNYRKQGLTAALQYSEVSPDFFPRIGFAPERNFKGPVLHLELQKLHSRSDIRETRYTMDLFDWDRYHGGHYRRGGTFEASAALRNNMGFYAGISGERFLDRYDSFYYAGLSMPRNDPYRGWGLDFVRGNVAGEDYQSATLRLLYRPVQRLQLSLRHQRVNHFTDQELTILGFNYQIGKFDSFGGRAVARDGSTNWYASYRHSGGEGIDYYIILGDPNASTFQRNVIVKAVFPVKIS